MNRQEIIRGAIADLTKRSIEDVNPSSRLAEDLGIRSIACVELAVLLERRLGIAVREDQVMTSGTVSELEHVLGA